MPDPAGGFAPRGRALAGAFQIGAEAAAGEGLERAQNVLPAKEGKGGPRGPWSAGASSGRSEEI